MECEHQTLDIAVDPYCHNRAEWVIRFYEGYEQASEGRYCEFHANIIATKDNVMDCVRMVKEGE